MDAGFIGIGNMGGAIARCLIDQGVILHIFDVNQEKLNEFSDLGARVKQSARAVADDVEIIFACLPSVEAAAAAALGDEGAVRGGRVRHYIEMSTIGSMSIGQHAAALASRNIQLIDAAVSGGSRVAAAGALAIMLAAPESAIAAVRPLLERISDKLFIVGERPGQGQDMKLVNNLLSAANMATSSEALVLGARMGLDAGVMVDVIAASSGRSAAMLPHRTDAILSGRFDTGPRVSILLKDIDLAMARAQALGVSPEILPSLAGVAELWRRAEEKGLRDEDVTTLIRVVEDMAGVTVRASGAGREG